MAVALSIEATEVGMCRSFDEEEDDRRDEANALTEGRERVSRRSEVWEPRLGGMTMGEALVNPPSPVDLGG